MSISLSRSETYPGRDCPLPQLLYAAKKKLQDTMAGERYAKTCSRAVRDSFLSVPSAGSLRL